jgi:hypothetical protein
MLHQTPLGSAQLSRSTGREHDLIHHRHHRLKAAPSTGGAHHPLLFHLLVGTILVKFLLLLQQPCSSRLRQGRLAHAEARALCNKHKVPLPEFSLEALAGGAASALAVTPQCHEPPQLHEPFCHWTLIRLWWFRAMSRGALSRRGRAGHGAPSLLAASAEPCSRPARVNTTDGVDRQLNKLPPAKTLVRVRLIIIFFFTELLQVLRRVKSIERDLECSVR